MQLKTHFRTQHNCHLLKCYFEKCVTTRKSGSRFYVLPGHHVGLSALWVPVMSKHGRNSQKELENMLVISAVINL